MASEDNRLFCEIVAALLIADAQVTDSEQRFLDRLMKRFEFTPDDRQAVINSVNIGESVEGRLRQLSPDRRPELLAELESAAIADGEVGRAEQDIIDEVRSVMERTL